MSPKFKITDSDKALFQDAVKKVKRHTHNKLPPVSYKPTRKIPTEAPEVTYNFSDTDTLNPVTGDEFIQFARPGIQHKILRKLKLGQYTIEGILDLHGKTVLEARQLLGDFLVRCKQRHLRHILIIHGKGHHSAKPILKNKLNQWLKECEDVLAFCSANIKHGAGGAVYVLLKNLKEGS